MKITSVCSLGGSTDPNSEAEQDSYINFDEEEQETEDQVGIEEDVDMPNESGGVDLPSVGDTLEEISQVNENDGGDHESGLELLITSEDSLTKRGDEGQSEAVDEDWPTVTSSSGLDGGVIITEPPSSPVGDENRFPDTAGQVVTVRIEGDVDVAAADAVSSSLSFSLDTQGSNEKTVSTESVQNQDTEISEVEVVGFYSGAPCSSSSFVANISAPLPKLLPKIEVNVGFAQKKKPPLRPCPIAVPTYNVADKVGLKDQQEVTVAMKATQPPTDPQAARALPPGRSCFNCDGDHLLHECTVERNVDRINQRRKEMRESKFQNQGGAVGRYHEQPIHIKYNYYKPGYVTKKLKTVMGLSENQQPVHIYNMRKFGYPPGWLQYAVEESQKLHMYGEGFGSKDRRMDDLSNNLDASKLVDYPGYTSPLPAGCIDDSDRYGVAYDTHDSRENVAYRWQAAQTAAKRQQQRGTNTRWIPETATSATQIREEKISNNNPAPWYDDVFKRRDPLPKRKPSTDMEVIDSMYEALFERRPEYNLATSGQNYRATMELERRAREVNQSNVTPPPPKRAKRRPSSPSLLEESSNWYAFNASCSNTPVTTSNHVATGMVPLKDGFQKRRLDDDEDVVIIDDSQDNVDNRPSKKPRLDTMDKIDDDDIQVIEPVVVPKVPPVYVKNPFYKPLKGEKQQDVNPSSAEASAIAKNKQEGSSSNIVVTDCRKLRKEVSPMITDTVPEVITLDESDEDETESAVHKDVSAKASGEDTNATEKDGRLVVIPGREKLVDVLIRHEDNIANAELKVFTNLPTWENFSKDMPPLPLEEEAVPVSGRMTKLLGIIREDKSGKDKCPTTTGDNGDSDVEILS